MKFSLLLAVIGAIAFVALVVCVFLIVAVCKVTSDAFDLEWEDDE